MINRRTLIMSCALLVALGAQARDPVSRYRVTEVSLPNSMQSKCLPAYATVASITKINDFGVFNALANCYTAVDPAAPSLQQQSASFFGAPWFDSIELPHPAGTYSYAYTINNRGELFGYESGTPEGGGGLFAARWTVSGGHERIFYDPACDTIQFQAAVDGNGRYILGWALRGDPSLPPPVDQLCIKSRWVIRDDAGVETSGPLGGEPTSINARNMAVGMVDRSAVRYHVPTKQLTILHASDSAHSIEANDINGLGEIAGRILVNAQPDFYNRCDKGTAVRWERDGRERELPNLPGAVASHAWAVGYDGETVGDSGAGQYCPFIDNSQERAVLWKDGRVYDLNSLIPRFSGITLTYAFSVNRRGQITAGGYVNGEPLTSCPSIDYDPVTMTTVFKTVPCHNQRMFVLNPLDR
jgi:uncharacterized membrane protein